MLDLGSVLLESLRFRIDPQKTRDTNIALGVKVTDTDETVGLIIRRGILEVTDSIPAEATAVIHAPKQLIAGIVLIDARQTLAGGTESGALTIETGTLDEANAFFDAFDPRSEERLHLADR
ncbi:alkyl sulfatase C-terminal domain-containing protein [Microbacterium sp. PRC9]|uniref:alkyl sulfatase C-terminal domain-containing protein n=1 Tax=Microbacterium sp. PRC9 TaxID=2962591 RepID=UPI0028811986|nr:alkyl sulfatase C-terminal domain-containing protein [Microbacterium sp. PRC9]MDT0141775.1 alkyl sulfatase C-terminal domain-containing protein [Microbacterium sp. PRC9]